MWCKITLTKLYLGVLHSKNTPFAKYTPADSRGCTVNLSYFYNINVVSFTPITILTITYFTLTGNLQRLRIEHGSAA